MYLCKQEEAFEQHAEAAAAAALPTAAALERRSFNTVAALGVALIVAGLGASTGVRRIIREGRTCAGNSRPPYAWTIGLNHEELTVITTCSSGAGHAMRL